MGPLESIALVSLTMTIGLLIPGYLLFRAFHLKEPSTYLERGLYAIGIGFVLLSLIMFWSNFFGLGFDSRGILIMLGLALAVGIFGWCLIPLTKRLFTKWLRSGA